MRNLRLAPSILTADFARLGEEVRAVAPYVDWFHLDVMDGHYVDNLTFGPSVVQAISRASEVPLHVHLMITDPAKYAGAFVEAGASRISFHPEVTSEPGEVVERIKQAGAAPGIAVHPDVGLDIVYGHLEDVEVVLIMTVRPGFGGQSFLPEVLPKIVEAKEIIESGRIRADIEVDGGVNLDTVGLAVQAGGDILVSGSAIFDGRDPGGAARRMREKLDQLQGGV